MTNTLDVVFLFDVDNTLIDNDRVQAHLKEHLEQIYGVATRDRYWEILEDLRNELGYVDYLGALERYRIEAMHRPEVLRMSSWLVDFATLCPADLEFWTDEAKLSHPALGPAIGPILDTLLPLRSHPVPEGRPGCRAGRAGAGDSRPHGRPHQLCDQLAG